MDNTSLCHVKIPLDLNASYEVAITENPANRETSSSGRKKRAAAKHTNFWAPGRTLRIAFLNGDQAFKEAVKTAANTWLPHVNLQFDFVEGEEGDIRIKSEPGVYWSYIGTNALTETDQTRPTMLLSPDHQRSLNSSPPIPFTSSAMSWAPNMNTFILSRIFPGTRKLSTRPMVRRMKTIIMRDVSSTSATSIFSTPAKSIIPPTTRSPSCTMRSVRNGPKVTSKSI